jgi:hypothetical protein
MQKGSFHIITAGITAGFISTLYFLMLMAGVPFLVIVPVILSTLSLAIWYLLKSEKEKEDILPLSRFKNLLLGVGLIYIVLHVYPLAEKYGSWDAWSIWNYHARFLAHPEYWQKLTWYRICHPDYPMLVPGFAGFFAKLTSIANLELFSFVFSFAFTLFIPVLIYLELAPKSLLAGGAAFIMLAGNHSFLSEGVSQYADTPLAFFFLSSMISVKYVSAHYKYVLLTACSLGCCLWTKNEGVILVPIFVFFYYRELFFSGNWKYFLAGISIPLAALVWYKTGFAPPNGMIAEQSGKTIAQLSESIRYEMILDSFLKNIKEHFSYIKVIGAFYLLSILFVKKDADKQFLMLLCCFVAYFMVYVVSVEDLKWHLFTSQNRLMHQLMPALLYVMCCRIVAVSPRQSVYTF